MMEDGGGGAAPTVQGKAAPFRLKPSKNAGKQQAALEGGEYSCLTLTLPPSYPGENERLRVARTEGLRECLEIIKTCTEESIFEASKGCVREVLNFISGWRFGEDLGRIGKGMGKNDLVPLAVVNAGLHLGDREAAVDQIRKGLSMSGSSGWCSSKSPKVVAVLRWHDCNTVESALSHITRQCLAYGSGGQSRLPLFMDNLQEWYAWYDSNFSPHRTSIVSLRSAPSPCSGSTPPTAGTNGDHDAHSGDSGSKKGMEDDVPSRDVSAYGVSKCNLDSRGASTAQRNLEGAARKQPAVVVMLEDVERLNKQVLRELMAVLAQPPCSAPSATSGVRSRVRGRSTSGRKAKAQGISGHPRCGRGFPLAVVAIASGGVGFPLDRLSQSAARQLSLEEFQFPSAEACVDILYRKLFIEGRLPIWLGPKVLGWMKTSFRDSHHSLGTLSRQLQRAALEHFRRPGSYLCLRYCRPWLQRYPLYQDCPRQATGFFSQKLKRDSARMPRDKLQSLLGVPVLAPELGELEEKEIVGVGVAAEERGTKISANQAERLMKEALHRQACNALRLWFLHKVLTVLAKTFGGKRFSRDKGRLFGGRGDSDETELLELLKFDARPVRVVVDVFSRKDQRAKELKKVAEAFSFLSPTAVSKLLGRLLDSLRRLPPLTEKEEGASTVTATVTTDTVVSNRRVPGGDGRTVSVRNEQQGDDERSACQRPPRGVPPCVEGLDREEAYYLRRGAERVLTLWGKANAEGWAEPCSGDSSLAISAVANSSLLGSDRSSNSKTIISRGSRFLSSALHQTMPGGSMPHSALVSDAGGRDAPETVEKSGGNSGGSSTKTTGEVIAREALPELDNDEREKALMRACLVREMQLLFLHVMGEARDCALGPGMEPPPPLPKDASVLAEAYCFNEPYELQASLCPLMRAQVDRGMMDGAGLGTSENSRKRKEMSKDHLISDACLMYSRYTGQGKIIPRSEWFASFKDAVREASCQALDAPQTNRSSPRTRNPQSSRRQDRFKGGQERGSRGAAWERFSVQEVEEGEGGEPVEGEGVICPTAPAEVRGRFDHAFQELAMMGYVKPSKRKRKGQEEGPGPKGAVARLVYNYTSLVEA